MFVDGRRAADTSVLETSLASPSVHEDAWTPSLTQSRQVRCEKALAACGLSNSLPVHHVLCLRKSSSTHTLYTCIALASAGRGPSGAQSRAL